MSISIAHRIELKPNNKQKTHFRKAFGCARLAWNWGLAEWQRQYKEGGKPSAVISTKPSRISLSEDGLALNAVQCMTETTMRQRISSVLSDINQ